MKKLFIAMMVIALTGCAGLGMSNMGQAEKNDSSMHSIYGGGSK